MLALARVHDWELKELEAALSERGGVWTAASWTTAALKFWRAQRTYVHERAVALSRWNNSLAKLAWRVDVKQRERGDAAAAEARQEASALVELVMEARDSSAPRVVRFELGKDQVAATARSLDAIQRALDLAARK